MSNKSIIFDLDGTLLDSLQDLANAMNYALEQLGQPVHPLEAYNTMVGDGVVKLAERALSANQQYLIEEAVEIMKTQYAISWSVYTKPYSGIEELLAELAKQDISMNVLSNKPDPFTKEMISYFFPETHFEWVMGASEQFPKKPDPKSANYICEQLGIAKDSIYYLGDTDTDMKTACSAGIHAIGVDWGFRNPKELKEHGAKAILSHPLDLLKEF